jgi:hypothetical protein
VSKPFSPHWGDIAPSDYFFAKQGHKLRHVVLNVGKNELPRGIQRRRFREGQEATFARNRIKALVKALYVFLRNGDDKAWQTHCSNASFSPALMQPNGLEPCCPAEAGSSPSLVSKAGVPSKLKATPSTPDQRAARRHVASWLVIAQSLTIAHAASATAISLGPKGILS